MNELERRLLHAARELRELELEPPPFETLGGGRRPSGLVTRIPAMVMPVLFVLGGLAIFAAGGIDRQADATVPPSAAAAAVAPVAIAEPVDDRPDRVAALTAREEIALIASLAPQDRPTTDAGGTPPAPSVRSLARHYR